MTGRADLLRLLRGSAFIFACRAAGAVLTFAVQILLARWMGAAALGSYVLALSWGILLATLATLGLSPAALRFVGAGLAQGESATVSAFVAHGFRVITLVSLLAGGTGMLVAWLTVQAPLRGPLLVAMATLPVLALLQFAGGVANGYSRFALSFIPTNVARPLLFCLLVLGAWSLSLPLTASRAMALQAMAMLLVAVPTLLAVRALVRAESKGLEQPAGPTPPWVRSALPLLSASLFASYFPEMIVIIAGGMLPSESLAVLHVGFRVAMLVTFGLFAVDAFTAPDMARLYANGQLEPLQQVVNRATRLRFVASVVCFALFVVAGKWLLGLFGTEFVAGYPVLIVLGIGQLVLAATGPVVRLLGVTPHQNHYLLVFAGCISVALIGMTLAVPRFGAVGAAWVATGVLSLWSLWLRELCGRLVGVRPSLLQARAVP